jgi:uncharacterized delta-60 repeat protein
MSAGSICSRWVLGACVFGAISPTLHAADGDPAASFGNHGFAVISAGDPRDRDGNRIEGQSLQLVPNAATVDSNRAIVVGGSLNLVEIGRPDPNMRASLMRFDAQGVPDASFGSDTAHPGLVVLPDLVIGTQVEQIEAVLALPDGLLAAGTATAFGPTTGFVVKLKPNGELDSEFAHGGALLEGALFHSLALDSRGNILVAGEKLDTRGGPLYRGLFVRFDAQGALLDMHEIVQPGTNQLGYAAAMRVLPDDSVLLAGSYQMPKTTPEGGFVDNYDFSIARLTPSGEFDTTFADTGWKVFEVPGAGFDVEHIMQLGIDSDGGIVFAAQAGVSGEHTALVLGKLSADGVIDESFGDAATPGFARHDLVPAAVNQLPSGLAQTRSGHWVVGAAYFGEDIFNEDFLAARVTRDGRLDPSFGVGGLSQTDLFYGGAPTDDVRTLVLHDDEPVLIGASVRVHADDDPTTSIAPAAVDTALLKLEHWPLFRDSF